ncbi:unnamed protein product [Caenorhabditis auriculariae]|uniref:Neprilysin-2 n=1 Tax=Caenorhabditis auriculariae TaxID=2777116 RepID=A0A8S1HHS6_9PELO|nr:unnamed protein product [Caenorhabditis auriculariae]
MHGNGTAKMPFGGEPPDYMHLRSNESQMQLITMNDTGENTPSGSPCFNTPTRDEPPAVIFIPGKASHLSSCAGTAKWWKSRTHLEKLLIPVCLLLLLLAVVLLAVVLNFDRRREAVKTTAMPTTSASPTELTTTIERSTTTTSTVSPEFNICNTAGCVHAANHLLNSMNTSMDPCQDFFEFACGAWNEAHPIPDDMFAYGTFSYVREQVRQQLRVLLEQEVTSQSHSINMARTAYKTCMNKTQLDELKSRLLFDTLEELGRWPLLQKNWDQSKFDLTDLLMNIRHDYGVDIFFQIYVYADAKNTSRNTLFVDQGILTLGRGSRDYYLNATMFNSHMTAYRKFIQKVAVTLKTDANLTRSDEEIYNDINEVIEFEKKFAKIIVAEDERRNNTRLYNRRNIADLYSLLPKVDWVSFMRRSAPPEMTHLFDNSTEIIIYASLEVSQLVDETDVKLLTNYVIWRVVQSNIRYLDERFDDIKQDFIKVMTGQQQTPPRWKDCAQVPSTVLPLAAGAIYVQAHFNERDKTEALEMIFHLRNSFSELVSNSDWMDEATKNIAIIKAHSMINNIGYPNVTSDLRELDELYRELEILDMDTYYSLMKKAVWWMQNREFRKLTKPFDKHEFDVSPAVVNAFYSPEKNAITFPAGILQPPFFSGSFPKAVNYGAIGAVIGHEITHGFDDQGSQYDKDGNLHNWWSESSMQAFEHRKRCIVEQYGNYTVPKTTYRVNGKLTQGENIADNGGVKEAYRAYQRYVKENGEEPRLPGLQQYSNQQIFFLSYAHFWCGQKKEAAAMQQVLTDEHSPEVFRVMGVLSNMHEFAEVYNCPRGSPINTDNKCIVW